MLGGIPVVNIVAWGSVVACVVATVICATKFAVKDIRLFTSLVFFALSWAILLPYYGLQEQKQATGYLSEVIELLPAYAGLLLILAGGPLRREASVRRSRAHRDPGFGKLDTVGLHLLYFIVLPHALSIPNSPDLLREHHSQIVMILGTLLTLTGFYSIVQGLRELTKSSGLWWFLFVLTLTYVGVEVWFTVDLLPNPARGMSDMFKWAYSGHKLTFTAIVLCLVVRETQHFRTRRAEEPGLSAT